MDTLTEYPVEVHSLTVYRGGAKVLSNLTLYLRPGSVAGLLGPSGSGKSTLIRSIVGVQKIASGSVRVLGFDAASIQARASTGYLTQLPSVYGDLTVRENLRYFASITRATLGRVTKVLEAVDLLDFASHRVDSLSGGQRARVSLATAMIGDPELLVLDEPTVGLDPLLRERLWDVFRGLAAQGKTLLVSSHVMDEADRCDRILLLREGALLADSTPNQLREETGATGMDEAFLRLVKKEVTE